MENKKEERLFENEIVAIIEKGKDCSRYAENFDTRENAYLDGVRFGAYSVLEQYHQPPTPAVDELNLDEEDIIQAARKAAKIQDEKLPFETSRPIDNFLNGFFIGAEWQSHHNHASFVALVEAREIELHRDLQIDPKDKLSRLRELNHIIKALNKIK